MITCKVCGKPGGVIVGIGRTIAHDGLCAHWLKRAMRAQHRASVPVDSRSAAILASRAMAKRQHKGE